MREVVHNPTGSNSEGACKGVGGMYNGGGV